MIVVHGESIDAAALPALIAGNHQGLATYRLLGHDAELVTLDATPPNTGTGTAIMEALVARLRAEDCKRLWLTRTNDKLSALRFYLRRDFRLMQVRPGAVGQRGVRIGGIDLGDRPCNNNSINWRARNSHARGSIFAAS
jgi:GNAT superfamily N-acetyltransferase